LSNYHFRNLKEELRTAESTIEVLEINHPPVAIPTTATSFNGPSSEITIDLQWSDPDGNQVTAKIVDLPPTGKVINFLI
jgi:hypothetical protein